MTVKTLTVSGLNVAAQVLGGTGLTSSTTNGVTTLSVSGTQASGTSFLNPTAGSYSELYVDSNDRRVTLGQRSSTNTGGDLAYLYTATATPMSFWTSATERLRITATGKVGIGTATPSAYGALTVAGDVFVGPVGSGGYGRLAFSTALVSLQSNVYWNGTSNLSSLAGYSSLLDLRLDDGSIRLSTSTSVAVNTALVMTERMIITAAGNVGIGTSSPATTLEIAGTGFAGLQMKRRTDNLHLSTGLYFDSVAASGTITLSGATLTVVTTTAGAWAVGQVISGTSITSTVTITALIPTTGGTGGNGTYTVTNSTSQTISGTPVAATGINPGGNNYTIRASAGGLDFLGGSVVNANGGTSKVYFSSAGNVGIGTISPRNLFELAASTVATSSSTTLRIGGIVGTYTAASYTAVGQEVNRHSIVFSSWRDAQTDTLGAKIQAINYTSYASGGGTNFHLVQNTDLAFYTLGVLPTTTDATVERMRITSAGNVGIGTTDPKATLHTNGTFALTTATSGTANSVILAAANYALPDAATCSGRMYWVKNTSASAILMTSAGGTIDGVAAATGVSLSQYDCYTVVSNGANWFVI